jgi:hypothetical protein
MLIHGQTFNVSALQHISPALRDREDKLNLFNPPTEFFKLFPLRFNSGHGVWICHIALFFMLVPRTFFSDAKLKPVDCHRRMDLFFNCCRYRFNLSFEKCLFPPLRSGLKTFTA